MQLPPYFDFRRFSLLETFLQRFPQDIPLAVEVRHASWFDRMEHIRDWLILLQQNTKQVVLTDVAGRRDVLHMGLSGHTAVIRFVGNNLHATDYERIDAWLERLVKWHALGLRYVYFFTHEPDNIKAPELAAYLWQKLELTNIAKSRGPKLLEPPAQQMQLF